MCRAHDKYMGGAGLQEMHLEILQSIMYLAMRCACNVVSYAQLGSLEHLCSVHVLGQPGSKTNSNMDHCHYVNTGTLSQKVMVQC